MSLLYPCALNKLQKTGIPFNAAAFTNLEREIINFFKESYYDYAIRDQSVFRKHYLDGHALPQSASRAAMEYNHTSVNLGSHVRGIFCEFVYSTYWTGMSKSMKACSVEKLNTIGAFLPQSVYGYLQWYNAVLTR